MKLVHVIPIVKGLSLERLSYFSSKKVAVGSIVQVPLRNRIVSGIITEIEDVTNVKSRLKSAGYTIKKIEHEQIQTFFSPEFIDAANLAADYFAGSIGATLYQVIPKAILDNITTITPPQKIKEQEARSLTAEKLILQTDEETRILQYKNMVREAFARNNSVFICAPTINDVEHLTDELQKGIEKYVFSFHSSISKKKLLNTIDEVIQEKHPVLIIATGSFLCIPRRDIKTVIIEKENARGYKAMTRPYVDFRTFATFFADKLGARLILGDLPLRVQTEWNYRRGGYDELVTRKSLITTKTKQHIVDMRNDPKDEKKPFKILSDELIELIGKAAESKENIFILNARRGLAPTTVCEDCGEVVMCKECSSPIVLHKSQGENIFICHKCSSTRSAKERCVSCRSWKLKALGVGIEKVNELLKKSFPNQTIFVIDKEVTKTRSQIQKVITKFYNTPGGILVGTETAISYLTKKIPYTAITSIDSLLLLPDALVYERIFSMLFSMRNIAEKEFLLQTRQPQLSVISHSRDGNVQGFFNTELEQRERFNYPPFSVLIKITTSGTHAKIIQEMEQLEKILKDYSFQIYPAFTPLGNRKYALHGVMQIPHKKWPQKELLGLLRRLPPQFSININPESAL